MTSGPNPRFERTGLIALALAVGACCTSARVRETQARGTASSAAADAGAALADSSAATLVQAEHRVEWVGGEQDAAATAQFRACNTNADCLAVPRVGCCHNGWQEAVAASQKDAYLASFTCPDAHPICAMFIIRDERKPVCDPAARLCTMVSE